MSQKQDTQGEEILFIDGFDIDNAELILPPDVKGNPDNFTKNIILSNAVSALAPV